MEIKLYLPNGQVTQVLPAPTQDLPAPGMSSPAVTLTLPLNPRIVLLLYSYVIYTIGK